VTLLAMMFFAGIFIITYAIIAISEEKKLITILAGATIATVAALFILEVGAGDFFTFERVFEHYIEWEVIVIITGMSLLVEALNKSHLFDFISIKVIKLSKGKPVVLMFVVFYLTFSLSALLDNVTAIILVSSITMTVCKGMDINPVPFFYSAIIATVTAGFATIVGSLPSIMIGNAAEFSFLGFMLVGLPLALVLSVAQILYFKFMFRKELEESSKKLISLVTLEYLDPWGLVENKTHFYTSIGVMALVVIGFVGSGKDGFIKNLFGIELTIGHVAIICAILLIALTGADIEKLVKRVHWDTVLFFIALFILVGTLEDSKLLISLAESLVMISGDNILLLLIIILIASAVLSAVVSNIALSAAFIPVIKGIIIGIGSTAGTSQVEFLLWWVLLAGVTFGGGFTSFGTAPAVVALGILREEGQNVSFIDFFKLMAPLITLMLVASFIYLLGASFILGG